MFFNSIFFFISGQSVDPNKEKIGAKLDKDFSTKQLIRDALMDNDLLKNLSFGQIREVIDFMQVKKITAGTYVSNKHWIGCMFFFAILGCNNKDSSSFLLPGRVLNAWE